MEYLNSLEQKVEALSQKMDDLKLIKHKVATKAGGDMDGWQEKVECRERKLNERMKELEILRREKYDDVNSLKAIETLSQKVIGNLKDVKFLRDVILLKAIELIILHSNKLKPKQFSHVDLSNYTSDSSKSVAAGAFSKVYRGQLDGMQVAIKVLEDDVAESFMVEMDAMVTASHPNLVTLYGYCFESNMKALVYEYMENGSLDKILFEKHLNLEWGKLYRIAIGIAKGLAYLHNGCDKQIIHRDVKPANVLIDENHSPKITDFGVAKLLSTAANHYTITQNQGTHGYIAPEFRNPTSEITKKCDVYSFGVMLYEVLTMRRNGKFGPNWFPLQIWNKFEEGQLDKLIESFGIPEIDKGKAKILSTVAFWCSQYTVEIRPSMSTVVEILEKEIPVNIPPYPFQDYVTSPGISMQPSLKVILEIHSEASPVIHERLATSNSTLAAGSDVFNKEEAEKKSDDKQALSNSSEQESMTSSETQKLLSEFTTSRPQQFSRSDIERFTSNFSMQIGSGGYEDVYKGQFQDGVKVAIRVLKYGDFQEEFFMKSVMIMGNVSHPQIVKLHGYCFDDNLKAIVCEYMENGALDRILYMNHLHIEWEQLYEIVIETAKGLSALHAVGIIHDDVKASNILLNSKFSPKIDCSGFEQLIKWDHDTHVTLTQVRGTSGYNAPEKWIPTSVVTSKSDVYSFGMLLFEVLGRRRNSFGKEWFPIHVWKMFNQGRLSKMMVDCGIKMKDREKAYNLAMVAFWCAQRLPKDRPSMSSVVHMLEMEIPVMDPPNPFPFVGTSTSSSSEGSPRFNREASPSIELSFLEKRSLEDSDDDSQDGHFFGVDRDKSRELEAMLNLFEEKCPPGGENSVVLYTRTVGWLGRSIECNYVRSILESHQVEIIERKISANWVELRKLLGTTEVPALFIHGRFIGGVNEVKSLEEEGKLKILLYGIQVERQLSQPFVVCCFSYFYFLWNRVWRT